MRRSAYIAVLLLAAAAVGCKLAAGGHSAADDGADVLTGAAYFACALLVARRGGRPGLARLLLLACAAWFAEDFVTATAPWLFGIGVLLAAAFDPVLLVLLLGHPYGRLQARIDRWLVGAAAAITFGFPALSFLVGHHPPADCAACHRIIPVLLDDGVASALDHLREGLAAALALTVLALLVQRHRAASGPLRRSLAPFTRAGLTVALAYAVLTVREAVASGDPVSAAADTIFSAVQTVSVLLFPLALVLSLWRVDALRLRVAAVILRRPTPAAFAAEARAVTGDGALRVVVGEAAAPDGLAATPLAFAGRAVGVLIHHPALALEPELLAIVCDGAADALDRAAVAAVVVVQDPDAAAAVARLSPRQREILALMADGLTNAVIARRLAISAKTVEKHVGNIMDVLGLPPELRANRRVGAATMWVRAGG